MSGLYLKALEFGVHGLCLITLILVWRLLKTESKREGSPRKSVLQASYVFMAFSLALVVLNAYVQLAEKSIEIPEIKWGHVNSTTNKDIYRCTANNKEIEVDRSCSQDSSCNNLPRIREVCAANYYDRVLRSLLVRNQ